MVWYEGWFHLLNNKDNWKDITLYFCQCFDESKIWLICKYLFVWVELSQQKTVQLCEIVPEKLINIIKHISCEYIHLNLVILLMMNSLIIYLNYEEI